MKSKYMKRIMLLATAALTISSCDSFLDTSPEDLRSPEQIYETYSSTQNAMFGVYSYIRDTYPFNMPDTYSTSDVDVAYTNVHTFLIWGYGVLHLHNMINGILFIKRSAKLHTFFRM